ncbi:FecR family protein [Paenochrobactrum sp. BZR 588]|uniref:FecR family protein n=1 Tax=unclassified Paenochrobactrum TaxID=2639760 RepID=UPI0038537734
MTEVKSSKAREPHPDLFNTNWSTEAEEAIDPLMQEAINWFSMLSDGQADAEQMAKHQNWLEADPQHAEAYAQVARMWGNLTHMSAIKRNKKSTATINRRLFGQLALMAVIGGGSGAIWLKNRGHDYQTLTGEIRQFTLADGSIIELSGESAVSVDFNAKARIVILHYGEAYFTVARSDKPFVVKAAEAQITALGTQFNVAVLNDQATVIVTEHAVRIDYAHQTATLHAGEKLIYANNIINPPTPSDDETDLAWRNGKLIFIARPLAEVLQELNRWSPVRLRLIDGGLSNHQVTLIVNISDIADIVPQLAGSLPIRTRFIPLIGTLIYRA